MVPYSRREQNKTFAAVYANLQYDTKEVSTYLMCFEDLLQVYGSMLDELR